PTVVLTDYTMYTPWLRQLEIRCVSLDVWDQIDPDQLTRPKSKLRLLAVPDLTTYKQRTTLSN
ncbi:uncharacterized protein M421DRAFT_32365, partial [Didymella exigua CBS 183.55]